MRRPQAMDGDKRYHPLDGTRGRFQARLDDEGRRDAFDTRLAALKAPAKTKEQRQRAFWTAVSEFSPPMQPADEPETETESEPSPRPSAATVSVAVFANRDALPSVRAISWVSSHVALDGVSADDAPDSASWALFRWVLADTANEKEFWKALFPMIVRAERDVKPEWTPPDPVSHRKVLEQINEITDEVYGRHEAGMARRLIENAEMWQRIKPVVEDALNNKRKHAAALGSIVTNIPRHRTSASEAEFLTETERWVGEDPDRRCRMLRDHLQSLVMTGRPARARSAPAESLAETPQPNGASA